MMHRSLPFLFLAMTIVACGPGPVPDKIPLSQTSKAPLAASEGLTGPVVEQLAASPYTYLRVKTAKGDVWTAVPEAKIETGTMVTVYNPMQMTNFQSKTLNRTFPEVYFGTLTPDTAAAAQAGTAANPHANLGAPSAPVVVGKVDKAAGVGARTVAEAWAELATIEGKPVTIRGTVVKYNPEVMGKNWIHLQDGTGDGAKGTNDITVTSLDETTLGETITVTGTAHTNKDFGAGYKYAIIIENAKIVKR